MLKFGAGTFSQRKEHFHNERNIFTLFPIQRQSKYNSDIPHMLSPMLSHQLHCHDYQDNMYIFTYTFYLYVLCTIKHPKCIRFTYTSCVSVSQTPQTLSLFSVRPFGSFNYTFDSPYTYTYYLYV